MKTILLSAGHSNKDPGVTVTVLSADGKSKTVLREADFAVDMRNMVSFYLSRAGVAHDLDGKATVNLPLSEAAAMARKHQLPVEFHCNGVADVRANGVEVLAEPSDMGFAAKLSQAIADALKLKNRGAKGEAAGHHSRLAFIGAGGLIIELFFLSNASDLAAYNARKWVAAKAIADAIMVEAGA